jgi:hypothetical protein
MLVHWLFKINSRNQSLLIAIIIVIYYLGVVCIMSRLQAGKFGVQIPAGATHLPLNQHDIVSLTQLHILKKRYMLRIK